MITDDPIDAKRLDDETLQENDWVEAACYRCGHSPVIVFEPPLPGEDWLFLECPRCRGVWIKTIK